MRNVGRRGDSQNGACGSIGGGDSRRGEAGGYPRNWGRKKREGGCESAGGHHVQCELSRAACDHRRGGESCSQGEICVGNDNADCSRRARSKFAISAIRRSKRVSASSEGVVPQRGDASVLQRR